MCKVEKALMRQNFSELTDVETWTLAKSGDRDAEEQLIERYASLVRTIARPLFLSGGDSEDLIQEGMLGLLSAVRSFDPEGASFRTYAEHCIRNRMLSAIKKAGTLKNKPLNDSIPIDSAENMPVDHDVEDVVIRREMISETESAAEGLSQFEKEVLSLYLGGMSYAEIAAETSKSVKSIDNAVQRIRRKLAT